MALLGFCLPQVFSSWCYYLSGIFFWLRGSKDAHQQGKSLQKKLKNRLVPLLSVLIDFQKAQCFFMIAIQIAAQVVMSNGLFEGSNLQQIYNNYKLLGVVAISGLLPVTFTLMCLHSAGMRSGYLIVLSTITVIRSAITLHSSRMFDIEKASVNSQKTFSECGDTNPTEKCFIGYSSPYNIVGLADNWTGTSSMDQTGWSAGYRMLVFSLATLGFLSAYLFRFQIFRLYETTISKLTDVLMNFYSRRTPKFIKKFFERLDKGHQLRYHDFDIVESLRLVYDHKFGILHNLVYLVFWIIHLYFFKQFFNMLQDPVISSSMKMPQWTFGQVVGITV